MANLIQRKLRKIYVPKHEARKQKIIIHLSLLIGVFVYLYSPLLDHWMGNEIYMRPHNHTVLQQDPHLHIHSLESVDHLYFGHHDHEHEEGFLCFLDINAVLAVLLTFLMSIAVQIDRKPQLLVGTTLFTSCITLVHLATLDPPPRKLISLT